jgi:amidase
MKRLSSSNRIFQYHRDNPVALEVDPGEVIVVETHDRFSGLEFSSPQEILNSPDVNAVTGAIFVRGASKGDTLKVEIVDIHLTTDTGLILVVPGLGAFGDRIQQFRVKKVPIGHGLVHFDNRLRLPLGAHVGRLAVAPEGDPLPTITLGSHGGNMDNNHLRAGCAIYLPVFVDGALLSLGDVHALQGDGESALSAVEVSADVTIRIDVEKGQSLTNPMVVTPEFIMTMADGLTFEEAARIALHEMACLIQNTLDIDYIESAMLISIAADLRICQIVNPRIGVKVLIPRQILNK